MLLCFFDCYKTPSISMYPVQERAINMMTEDHGSRYVGDGSLLELRKSARTQTYRELELHAGDH